MSGKRKSDATSATNDEGSLKLTLDNLALQIDEPKLEVDSATAAEKNDLIDFENSKKQELTLGFSMIDALEEADRSFANKSGFDGPNDMGENSMATVVGQLADARNIMDQIKAETAKSANIEHPLDEFQDDNVKTTVGKITGTLSGIPAPQTVSKVVEELNSEFENYDITQLRSSDKEFETLKKYASLKERESREKEAIAEVLRKQIIQIKNKLELSDKERRRITLAHDELKATVSSLKDAKELYDQKLRKFENQHQEQLNALQAQVDSHQFAAQRADRKLTEFRDRVRQDLLKIRSKERELANKLDLQKRDAEILLQGKDERLLSQRREIDRLEFEMQSLKERMIDETSKAEERAAKLTRALQSLRMAQGVLSDIDEEVLPGGMRNSKKGDAA
jgi:hypothetical protein